MSDYRDRNSSTFGMSFRNLTLVLATFVVPLACTRDAERSAAVPSSGALAATGAPSATAIALDTAGCRVITKRQFAEPEQLVSEWIRRDTLGYFVTPDDRLFELTVCPEHLGGSDEIIIAADPRVQRLPPVADSAVFLITYRRFGRVHADSTGDRETFVAEPGTDSVTVKVVQTPWGWRFPYDIAPPHLSPRLTLERIGRQWDPQARDSLKALAERLEH